LAETAAAANLSFRVYAAAPWPVGSRCVFTSASDWDEAFVEAARRGVWWELGRRWDLAESFDLLSTPAWSGEVSDVLSVLRPLYEKID